jgi:predicted metal-dependent hydrolase
MTQTLTRRDRLQRATLSIKGREVPVILRANKRARRMILKVDPMSREVVITSPTIKGFSQALAFAAKHEAWIARRLAAVPEPVPFAPGAHIPLRGVVHEIVHDATGSARTPVRIEMGDDAPPRLVVSGQAPHLSRRVTDWLKKEARRDLTDATMGHAAAFGMSPSKISLRDTASRWGSCSTSRVISFSWRLIFAPPFALNYVAAHEAAHLVEHNHGPRFWALVRTRIDDIEQAKNWLNANGSALHRYGAGPISN